MTVKVAFPVPSPVFTLVGDIDVIDGDKIPRFDALIFLSAPDDASYINI